jgi:ribose transport system substrate-binding protein
VLRHAQRVIALVPIAVAVASFAGSDATSARQLLRSASASQRSSSGASIVSKAKAAVIADEASWTAAKIGFPKTSPPAAKHVFLVSVSCGLQIEGCRSISDAQIQAGKAIGWKTQQIDGAGSPAGWNTAISQAIGLHPQVLAFGGGAPSAVGGLLKEANAKGIVVLCTTCGGQSGVDGVSYDNGDADISDKVGAYSANYVLSKAGTHADTLILNYPELGGAIIRVNAFKHVYAKCTTCKSMQINVSTSEWGTTLPGKLETILQQNPKINWIFNPADETAIDSANAIRAAGLVGKVFAIGGNGELQSYQRVRQDPTYAAVPGASYYFAGWQAIDGANRILHHQKPVAVNQPVRLFTKANVSAVPVGQYWSTDVNFRGIYQKLWGVK